MPLRFSLQILSFRSNTLSISTLMRSALIPNSPARLSASYRCALCSSALVGMQPRLRQVPPSWSFSIRTTLSPRPAAYNAVTYPPGPPPITATSVSMRFMSRQAPACPALPGPLPSVPLPPSASSYSNNTSPVRIWLPSSTQILVILPDTMDLNGRFPFPVSVFNSVCPGSTQSPALTSMVPATAGFPPMIRPIFISTLLTSLPIGWQNMFENSFLPSARP